MGRAPQNNSTSCVLVINKAYFFTRNLPTKVLQNATIATFYSLFSPQRRGLGTPKLHICQLQYAVIGQ